MVNDLPEVKIIKTSESTCVGFFLFIIISVLFLKLRKQCAMFRICVHQQPEFFTCQR